jgi:hypothetical protein
MAGSSNTLTSRERVQIGKGPESKFVEKVTVDWVGDDATGAVPDLALELNGFLVKVITNPGSTAPTANYDISLEDPEDNALDAAATLLNNRHTSTTEQVYPLISGASTPILLCGTYNVAVSNNSVNSATGRIIFHLVEGL